MTKSPRVAPRQIFEQDLFIRELKTALRAFIKAREMADQAAAETLMDEAWDTVAELEGQTRRLIQTIEDAAD